MTWTGPEGARNTILGDLQSAVHGLPVKLPALETRFGDGISLPVPDSAAYHKTYRSRQSLPLYPAVVVEFQTGTSPVHTPRARWNLLFDIWIYAKDPVLDTLQTLLDRYQLAVMEIVDERNGVGGFTSLDAGADLWRPIENIELGSEPPVALENTLIAGLGVGLTLHRQESRT